MSQTFSFKFVDGQLNRKLIVRLKHAQVAHVVDKDGTIRYSAVDEEMVENDLIRSIRDTVFSSWQILSCPKHWSTRYKEYMIQHDIPFTEELIDDQLCFLIPRKYRPHSWKLEALSRKQANLVR